MEHIVQRFDGVRKIYVIVLSVFPWSFFGLKLAHQNSCTPASRENDYKPVRTIDETCLRFLRAKPASVIDVTRQFDHFGGAAELYRGI